MKLVLLAGGLGTRLSEETALRPKPMVEIGGRPILWHIMKAYLAHGIRDVIVCLGYKGEVIKEFFADYARRTADVTYDFAEDRVTLHRRRVEPWRVTLVDTGAATMTGGRVRRVREYLDGDGFCLTYGDGVADIDITRLVEFHRRQGVLCTLTAAKPPGRFGALVLGPHEHRVTSFREKADGDEAWVNAGFFVVEPKALNGVKGDDVSWEREPLEALAAAGQLAAYRHRGFWQPMDTLHDLRRLQGLWDGGSPPWKVWTD